MGGTTSVTIRKADGEEFRMTRWTNSMPWGIGNNRMFEGDNKHIDDYLSQWIDMKRDWELNHISGKFQHEMTECYFPGAGLAPCGYGLTVVDHVNKVILDMQGYTSFHVMHPFSIINDRDRGLTEEDGSSYIVFKELFEAGRIKGVVTAASHEAGLECEPLDMTFDEILQHLEKHEFGGGKKEFYNFVLDTSPFTIERFEEYNSLEMCRMHLRVQELGFVLTDEEQKTWSEAIVEAKECEEEDG